MIIKNETKLENSVSLELGFTYKQLKEYAQYVVAKIDEYLEEDTDFEITTTTVSLSLLEEIMDFEFLDSAHSFDLEGNNYYEIIYNSKFLRIYQFPDQNELFIEYLGEKKDYE